jgi:phosphatidate cytidylyltransferase
VLRWRLISAAAILTVVFGLIAIDFFRVGFSNGQIVTGVAPTGIWLFPLILAIALMGASEVTDLLNTQNLRPSRRVVLLGTFLIVVASSWTPIAQFFGWPVVEKGDLGRFGLPMVALAVSVTLAFGLEMQRFERPGGVIIKIALAVFAMTYVGLFSAFLVRLRLHNDHRWGMAAMVSAIWVVKWSDVGAYTVGRLFGRYKITPRLSPGKTLEGFFGAALFGCLSSMVYVHVIMVPLWGLGASSTLWWQSILYGLILAAIGAVGDLAESLIKRDLGAKDSSHWLPGLGGILDVMDSPFMVACPAYLCWEFGLVGP